MPTEFGTIPDILKVLFFKLKKYYTTAKQRRLKAHLYENYI